MLNNGHSLFANLQNMLCQKQQCKLYSFDLPHSVKCSSQSYETVLVRETVVVNFVHPKNHNFSTANNIMYPQNVFLYFPLRFMSMYARQINMGEASN